MNLNTAASIYERKETSMEINNLILRQFNLWWQLSTNDLATSYFKTLQISYA